MSFSLRWKYPRSAKRDDKFLFYIMLICFPVIVFSAASKNKLITREDLSQIKGTLINLKYPSTSRDQTADLQLNEYPDKSYSFNMRAFYSPYKIKPGDSVTLLVSSNDLENNLNDIRSYELLQSHKQIFTVKAYNTSVSDRNQFYKTLIWIAAILIVFYLIIEKTGLIPKIKKLMDSPDSNFKPENEKPNFNEFLDR